MLKDLANKKSNELSFKEKLILAFYENAMMAVTGLVIVLLFYAFGFKIVAVDGNSMLPTLHHGDRLVVTAFCNEPKQGDVIISTQPNYFGNSIVKRVIATENQTVDIDFSNGDVFVDGELLDEPYINNLTLNKDTLDLNPFWWALHRLLSWIFSSFSEINAAFLHHHSNSTVLSMKH